MYITSASAMADTTDDLYVYKRTLGDSEAWVICNLADAVTKYRVRGNLSDKHIVLQNGSLSLNEENVLTLPPFGSIVFMTE